MAARIVPIGIRRKLDDRLLRALEVLPIAISWIRLTDGVTEFCNGKFVELFGYAAPEIPTVFDLIQLTYADPEVRERALDDLRHLVGSTILETIEFDRLELEIVAKDGTVKTVQFTGVVIPEADMAMATFLEITAQKERERLVQRLAEEDPLTGLGNRRAFDAHLGKAMEEIADGEALHLLLIDLDGFKLINDTEGHTVGDRILIEVAQRLKGVLRRGDVIARWGGDEFGILASTAESGSDIAGLRGRIVDAFARPFSVEGADYSIGATIGEARYPAEVDTPLALFKLADERMYEAKRAKPGRAGRRGLRPPE